MMKSIVYSLVCSMLIGLCCFDLQAQSDDTSNDEAVKKVKVNIVITKDGETKNITREFEVPDGVEIEAMLRHLEDDENVDADIEDGHVRVEIKKDHDKKEHGAKVRVHGDKTTENVAFLGITGYTTNANSDGPKEVRLMKVIEGTPAHKAGLKNEDILTTFDGEKVSNYEQLVKAIHAKNPGDVVEVKVRRDGAVKTFSITLGEHEHHRFDFKDMHHFKGDFDFDMVTVDVEMETLNDKDREVVSKSLGVDMDNTINQAQLNIFPNPGDGNFSYTLKLPEGGEMEVFVLDQSGKQVLRQKLNSAEGNYKGDLNLENSPEGTYILVFKKGDKILSEKLIKS